MSDQPISIDTSFFDYELNAAIDKMSKGQFQDAITLYTKKFQNEKNMQKKEYAVEQLAACYREIDSTTSGGTAKEKEFIDFLIKVFALVFLNQVNFMEKLLNWKAFS